MNLKIEYIDIDSIKPYKNNAKQHPREQIEQIKESIKKFGMDDPIGIWRDEVVEGHGRLIACKELGYTEVPIIRLDHLSDEERKAYTLVHNKLTMNSDFDIDILEEELLNIDNIDMNEFGFDFTNIEEELDDGLEQKKEEQETSTIDPDSFIYIGGVSIYGDTGDTLVYYDINKELANKIMQIVNEKGEEVVSSKIMEALNDL